MCLKGKAWSAASSRAASSPGLGRSARHWGGRGGGRAGVGSHPGSSDSSPFVLVTWEVAPSFGKVTKPLLIAGNSRMGDRWPLVPWDGALGLRAQDALCFVTRVGMSVSPKGASR